MFTRLDELTISKTLKGLPWSGAKPLRKSESIIITDQNNASLLCHMLKIYILKLILFLNKVSSLKFVSSYLIFTHLVFKLV